MRKPSWRTALTAVFTLATALVAVAQTPAHAEEPEGPINPGDYVITPAYQAYGNGKCISLTEGGPKLTPCNKPAGDTLLGLVHVGANRYRVCWRILCLERVPNPSALFGVRIVLANPTAPPSQNPLTVWETEWLGSSGVFRLRQGDQCMAGNGSGSFDHVYMHPCSDMASPTMWLMAPYMFGKRIVSEYTGKCVTIESTAEVTTTKEGFIPLVQATCKAGNLRQLFTLKLDTSTGLPRVRNGLDDVIPASYAIYPNITPKRCIDVVDTSASRPPVVQSTCLLGTASWARWEILPQLGYATFQIQFKHHMNKPKMGVKRDNTAADHQDGRVIQLAPTTVWSHQRWTFS